MTCCPSPSAWSCDALRFSPATLPRRRQACWRRAGYGTEGGRGRGGWDGAFARPGWAELGVALTGAGVPLWVHLSLREECRSRVEGALSGPAESRDARRNMQLNTALGAALFVMKGSSPEMLAAFTSAFEIAESLDDADYRLRALCGLFIDRIT